MKEPRVVTYDVQDLVTSYPGKAQTANAHLTFQVLVELVVLLAAGVLVVRLVVQRTEWRAS